MKREIKFRGKVEIGVKKPFWIYGDLVRFNEKSCIHSLDENGYHRYTVNSETVGQFTGLQDKNGKDIFEGDIIHFKYWDKVAEKGFDYVVGEVVFENGGFYVKENFPYTYEDEMSSPDSLNNWLKSENCYITCNIHYNPELL